MLKYLFLQNFRSFKKLEFEPKAGFLILTGANGTGKSNILESIFYLGAGYSFRQVRDDNLINFGCNYFIIRGIIEHRGIDNTIEVVYTSEQRRKTTKINKKNIMAGSSPHYLPVVIFSPLDLMLVKGGPSGRRRFIDLIAGQLRPQHGRDLHDYNSILQQRNKQLRGAGVSDEELIPWERQLASVGARIWKRRLAVLHQLLAYSAEAFACLSEGKVIEGIYKTQAGEVAREMESDQYQQILLESLARTRNYNRRVRTTTVGPHRDDFILYLNKREARLYASQGEQRLISLALKIGHYRILSQLQQMDPLLLLDDVFSELDEKHRVFVLEGMKQGSQVIAATTTSFRDGSVEKENITDNIMMVYQKKR